METLNPWFTRHGYKTFSFDGYDLTLKDDGFDKELETRLKEADKKDLHYRREWIAFDDATECKTVDDEGNNEKRVLLISSTSDVDASGDVILPKGINLSRYRKNNTLLWDHRKDLLPVGIAEWTKVVETALRQSGVMAKKPPDWPANLEWLPDTIHWMIAQKVLKGVSIGFLPENWREPTQKELKANPSWATARRVLDKVLLLETSFVTIGCNENALAEAVTKGLYSKDHFAELGFDVASTDVPTVSAKSFSWLTSDLIVEKKAAPAIVTPQQLERDLLKKLCL